MLDTRQHPVMQRARGRAFARFANGQLRDLEQSGCGKAILPRVRGVTEVVFLNTAGGLTSGDQLFYGTDIDGGRIIATTQAAERAYRAEHGPARVEVRHRVGAGGWLDWLPQETILFDRSDVTRDTVINLADDRAGCLMVEAVVLGRAAMGEHLRAGRFLDRRQITRRGKPVFFDPFSVQAATMVATPRAAILADARAFATIVLCTQNAQDAVSALRATLTVDGVTGAVSGFDGKCVIRLLAGDGWPLRRQILQIMDGARQGARAPRVWQI